VAQVNRLRTVDRLWLLGGLLAVLALLTVGWFGFIGPRLHEAGSVRGQDADARQHVTALQRELTDLRRRNDELPRYRDQLRVDQEALPAAPDSAEFLRSLQALSEKTGTTITGVTVGAQTAIVGNPKVRALPVVVSARGTAKQLGDFLDRLQNGQPRAVLVNMVDVTAEGPDRTADTFTLSVSLNAFVAPASGTS
jgi:Tfp pilus assembly protein PilO